jgi:hypothetical protein
MIVKNVSLWRDRGILPLIQALPLLAVLMTGVAMPTSNAIAASPNWSPKISERLIKLPSVHLKRAIDSDFKDSTLANAIGDTADEVSAKTKTVSELKEAMERAEGSLATELRHQALVEKQNLIKLMGTRQDLKKKHLKTKVRLYKRLLRKANNKTGVQNASSAELKENQAKARNRFERTLTDVDMKLFRSSTTTESKYSKDYIKNSSAIDRLASAINSHPMNSLPEIDGRVVGKSDFLRQLVAGAESELAILNQEESILGYMAKLVALDAMALSEGLDAENFNEEIEGDESRPGASDKIDLFVS